MTMEITLPAIQRLVTPAVYKRGLKVYREGRVRLERADEKRIEAYVEGHRYYHVVIRRMNGSLDASCDCPFWGNCKHVAAALFEARAYAEKGRAEAGEADIADAAERLLAGFSPPDPVRGRRPAGRWQSVFLIEPAAHGWFLAPRKMYVRRNGSPGRVEPLGPWSSDSSGIAYAASDPYVLSLLRSLDETDTGGPAWLQARSRSKPSEMRLFRYGGGPGSLFDQLRESRLFLSRHGVPFQSVAFKETPVALVASVGRRSGAFSLTLAIETAEGIEALGARARLLTADPAWILRDHVLLRAGNRCPEPLLRITDCGRRAVPIPESRVLSFLERFSRLQSDCEIRLPKDIPVRTVEAFTEKRLALTEEDGRLGVSLSFVYAGLAIEHRDPHPFAIRGVENPLSLIRISRDSTGENEALARLRKSGIRQDASGSLFVPGRRAIHWLLRSASGLAGQGFTVTGVDRLTRYRIRTDPPILRVAVTSGIDWFDLAVEADFHGVTLHSGELLDAVRRGTRTVKLPDGSMGELPETWMAELRAAAHFGKPEGGRLRFSPWHAALVAGLAEQAGARDVDAAFSERIAALDRFTGIRHQETPADFHGTLRPYQHAGLDWLCFLRDHRLGGLLADDMGLGKTVQALAFLAGRRDGGAAAPSLIVCPTSVVFNWESEIRRFTPGMRSVRHTGQERAKDGRRFRDFDLVITSYGVLLRDIEAFRSISFQTVILDESQKIKNPATFTSRAVRLLKAEFRLALTGTPVENRSVELWSQFAFLNPGLLGSLPAFKRGFARAIDRGEPGEAGALLRRMVHPFILRRTKESVASELPAKVEQVFRCPMNAGQERLYRHWKDHYRTRILEKIRDEGLQRSQMLVIEGLLRLRQIACHPRLVGDGMRTSEKFESLKDILDDVLAEGHKVLVFSQFVQMLTIIREHLDARRVPYTYLDGRTRDREKAVNLFQSASGPPVFLISLRAGGTGINLTAADYVVLYDPWWNPAVESQAVDRAHRIGQTRRVFVVKMISADTIEEKVLELQERKRRIVSNLMTGDAEGFKALTREDIEFLFK
jgi:non-specific serine/threonine protein kinase